MPAKPEPPEPASYELAEVDSAAPETVNALAISAGMFDPDLDFRKLLDKAAFGKVFVSRGFRLVEKEAMQGVPFFSVNATYRDGYKVNGIQGDYLSLECVVADKDTLNSMQVRSQLAGDLLVYPNELVVINDGGTGIRREITRLLHDNDVIDVGGDSEDPRRYDRPMSQWKSGADLAATGISVLPTGEEFRYLALRGLRKSEYENEYGPGTTWYFA